MEERSIEERVAALEGAITGLIAPAAPETAATDAVTADTAAAPVQPFWALEGLRAQTEGMANGAVLFTGIVDLPTAEHYEWQIGLPVERLLTDDWSEPAAVLGALGHPVRLTLLRRVLEGVRNVADLAQLDGLGTTGQIYHHLRQLVGAGWLRSTARGLYEVPGERVIPLLVLVMGAQKR
jgi:hypothetical protein